MQIYIFHREISTVYPSPVQIEFRSESFFQMYPIHNYYSFGKSTNYNDPRTALMSVATSTGVELIRKEI